MHTRYDAALGVTIWLGAIDTASPRPHNPRIVATTLAAAPRGHSRPPASRRPARRGRRPAPRRGLPSARTTRCPAGSHLRVVTVSVATRRDQDKLWPEFAADRYQQMLEHRQPCTLAGPAWNRNVDREAPARPRARVAQLPGARNRPSGGYPRPASGRWRKISAVPLPWCTSQSMTITRCSPVKRSPAQRRAPRC